MAEDFHAAFGFGREEKHVSPSDTGGVALAAIQGLNAELQKQHRRIQVQGWLLGLMLLAGVVVTVGRWRFG